MDKVLDVKAIQERCEKFKGLEACGYWERFYLTDCPDLLSALSEYKGLVREMARELDEYEYPPEIKNIRDRCEANVAKFSNDDVSLLLVEISRLSRTFSNDPRLLAIIKEEE